MLAVKNSTKRLAAAVDGANSAGTVADVPETMLTKSVAMPCPLPQSNE